MVPVAPSCRASEGGGGVCREEGLGSDNSGGGVGDLDGTGDGDDDGRARRGGGMVSQR